MPQPIKDDAGRLLGHFLTNQEYQSLLAAHDDAAYSDDDHAKALALIESGEAKRAGKSTAEVLAMLQELERILPANRT